MTQTTKRQDVDEAMRLASLWALARCARLTLKKEGEPVKIAQAELRVVKANQALRNYLENEMFK